MSPERLDEIKRVNANMQREPAFGEQRRNWIADHDDLIKEVERLTKPPAEWRWYGHAGHLCTATSCRFHLCTEVGEFLISTVGDYYPAHGNKRESIGGGDDAFFETYVFSITGCPRCQEDQCGQCGMPTKFSWSEIDGERSATAAHAVAAHMRYCHKYASIPTGAEALLEEIEG